MDISFPTDRRELFSTLSVAVWICSQNISLRSEGKWMFTIMTVGKSSFLNFPAYSLTNESTDWSMSANQRPYFLFSSSENLRTEQVPGPRSSMEAAHCLKNAKFLCGHLKGHSPLFTPVGSLHTLFFVVTSAHILLGPFTLMLRLLDQALYLDELYSCTVIMLSHLCRPVWHFAVMGAHTLLSPICSTPWHHLRLLSCAHTVLGSAILLYIYTLVQSLFSLRMWSVNNCTVQLYTR